MIWGKDVTIASHPRLEHCFQTAEPWTEASLQQHLGPHFEKLEPLQGGFLLPAV